jgi:hypothetical protein
LVVRESDRDRDRDGERLASGWLPGERSSTSWVEGDEAVGV